MGELGLCSTQLQAAYAGSSGRGLSRFIAGATIHGCKSQASESFAFLVSSLGEWRLPGRGSKGLRWSANKSGSGMGRSTAAWA
jgi:hypothetical protein